MNEAHNSPEWHNQPITLYHGTSIASALAMQQDGVSTLKGEPNSDFGVGLYTTTSLSQAEDWAEKKAASGAAVVRFTLDRLRLRHLRTLAFVRGQPNAGDYWSFVEHCRVRSRLPPFTSDYYDVVYRPVAKFWLSARRGIWKGYDQVSFHGQDAAALLNDKNACTVEVIP